MESLFGLVATPHPPEKYLGDHEKLNCGIASLRTVENTKELFCLGGKKKRHSIPEEACS